MVRKRELALGIFALLILSQILVLVSAQTADVGYIINGRADQNIIDVFEGMNLNVHIIEDTRVVQTDLSQFDFIFIGDGRVRNTAARVDVSKYPTVIMNKFYGEEFGLTDRDGVSQLGASAPLSVRKISNNRIEQVYTHATNNGISI